MENKIKLVCIDLDGTLLNDEKEISQKSKNAIKKATENGVKVVISTGRFFNMASHFSNILELDTPVISSNGAYVRRYNDQKEISKTLLGHDNCLEIFKVIKKYKLDPFFNDHETIFIDEENEYLKFNAKINGRLAKLGKSRLRMVEDWEQTFIDNKNRMLKCLVVNNDAEKLVEAKNELLTFSDLELVSSLNDNFEVMKKGVSKGRAVQALKEMYNITKEEIICIGDGENDLAMIEYAGTGVAMKNGLNTLKEKADYITLNSNNNDGVAEVFNKFVLI